ncbi:unnamed protein product [Sphagnum compactum]
MYARVIQACAMKKSLEHGKQVHYHIIKSGFKPDVFLWNNLLSMYMKCRSIVNAHQVFDEMPTRDVVSWTTMISGYAQQGYGEQAFYLFGLMQQEGLKPDKYTFSSVLHASGSPGTTLEQGKRVHALILEAGLESNIHTDARVANALISMYVRCGSMVDAHQIFDNLPQRDVVSWTAIIGRYSQQHMYARCGSVEDARKVFDKLPRRDVISWTAMISAYTQHGLGKEAINLFWQMEQEGVKPDKVTFNTVLNACASLAVLDKGRQVHACIIEGGFERDVFVGNALVDMYSKAGSLEDARQAFDNISLRDVVSWSTMILAYAQHGHGQEALQLFEQMQQEGVKPDLITFMGVLSACSNVGLVDEGQRYFQSMSRDHALTPTVEHYGCMVDILGRAGCIKEVQQVILEMPVQPDSALWGSLLAACKQQGNVEVGEWAAENRLKLEPQNAGTYILLSNIYAAARKWDDVAMVRKVMEFRGLTNETGQISVRGQ